MSLVAYTETDDTQYLVSGDSVSEVIRGLLSDMRSFGEDPSVIRTVFATYNNVHRPDIESEINRALIAAYPEATLEE